MPLLSDSVLSTSYLQLGRKEQRYDSFGIDQEQRQSRSSGLKYQTWILFSAKTYSQAAAT